MGLAITIYTSQCVLGIQSNKQAKGRASLAELTLTNVNSHESRKAKKKYHWAAITAAQWLFL